MKHLLILSAVALAGCSSAPPEDFMSSLRTLCGQTVTGAVVSDDPEDADWRAVDLVVGPVECSDTRVALPLAVGEDTSRTWIFTPTETGVHFTHQHLHSDGTPDDVTGYGGTDSNPSATLGSFPADAATIANFKANGLDVSITNIWTVEILPGEQFIYTLRREGRHFQAEFDL
jgi:hypothetical protein